MPKVTQSDDGLSPQFSLPHISEAGVQFQRLTPASEPCQKLSTQVRSSGQQEVCQRQRWRRRALRLEKPGRHRLGESLSEPAWRHLAARSLTCTRELHPPARRPALPLEPPPARPPFPAQSAAAFAAEKRAPSSTSPLTPHAGLLGRTCSPRASRPHPARGVTGLAAYGCAPWHTAGF